MHTDRRLDPGAQPPEGAEQEIAELVAAAVRHQADVEPFLALHTDDVVIVNIAGRRVLGSETLEAAMRSALSSPLADVTTTVEVEDIRFLRRDIAIVSCTKHVRDARSDASDELPSAGAMSYIVVDDGDGWRIALAQTTPTRT